MRFLRFEIRNFKGIKHAILDLNKQPKGNIYTLVGLNESGKTTILEAINYLISNNKANYTDLYDKSNYSSLDNPIDLIPLHRRGFFDEQIIVKANVQLTSDDIKKICDYTLRTHNHILDVEALGSEIVINRKTKFDINNIPSFITEWTINLCVKTKKSKNYKLLTGKDDEWQDIIAYIKSELPQIMYFPTFLFDFPKKIYLDDSCITDPQKLKINSYYKNVFQDILENIYTNQSLDSLIYNRISNGTEEDIKSVESALLQLSQKISKEVFGLWNEIFKVQISTKTIDIKHKIDKDKQVYLELTIKDGVSIYNIAQRSLGFRWFFCFLLFTHIRIKKNKPLFFLFDEPASNLHSSAQQQLLTCFANISDNNSQIIYTTHSQYMINPLWLENTYVVENKGLKNDLTDINDYNAVKTEIIAEPYRKFVNEHPDKTTYFQPILDLLQYQPSKLENIPNVAMFEGKTDFYFINYFYHRLNYKKKINILPGMGCGELSPLICLYVGWGKKFLIILDGDKAGKKSKSTYQSSYLLGDDEIFTLDEIDSKWSKIESLISLNDKKTLLGGVKNKKQLDRIFQELLAKKDFSIVFDEETEKNMKRLIDFIILKLK